MKRILCLLAISFVIVRCTPDNDFYKTVKINFANDVNAGATVTFTGDQSQGSFTFNADPGGSVTKFLPNTGTYTICISNFGGCVGYFESINPNTPNIYSINPCASGRTPDNEYFAFTQCE